MWEGVPQCAKMCPSVGGCSPVWKGGPSVGSGASEYGRVSPSVGGCAPVCVYVRCGCPCHMYL